MLIRTHHQRLGAAPFIAPPGEHDAFSRLLRSRSLAVHHGRYLLFEWPAAPDAILACLRMPFDVEDRPPFTARHHAPGHDIFCPRC